MSARFFPRILLAAIAAAAVLCAQRPGTNYDEAKVPKYTLPDPLTLKNGKPVRDAQTWLKQRRPEIVALFESEMHGRSPGRPERMTFELASIEKSALGGKAIRKEVVVNFAGTKDGPQMRLLLYLPAGARKPAPVVLGLNFQGNHTADTDPGIAAGEVWTRDNATKVLVKRVAPEDTRGAQAERWQLEKILAHGYGLATIYYCDIEPDFDGGMQYGVRPLSFKAGQTAPANDEWGAVAAWAWGMSRAMDYLVTDKDVDPKRVAIMGHSRLGKATLWAGALDTRFALVISNDSGEGGAAISRRVFGETVENLNTRFPWWFDGNYRKYSDKEAEMPFDAHMLLALIAPRPLYVASAEEDQWADPRGEFLAAVAAGPVYKLFGKQGIGTDKMPAVNQPVGDTVRYHVRTGKHDVTAYDWDQYLAFMDKHLQGRR